MKSGRKLEIVSMMRDVIRQRFVTYCDFDFNRLTYWTRLVLFAS